MKLYILHCLDHDTEQNRRERVLSIPHHRPRHRRVESGDEAGNLAPEITTHFSISLPLIAHPTMAPAAQDVQPHPQSQPQPPTAQTGRQIRPATASDMTHLKSIEDAADQLFIDAFRPDHWDQAPGPEERMEHGGWVLVALDGEPNTAPVGFVHVLDPSEYQPPSLPSSQRLTSSNPSTLNRVAHIEALAVHPFASRRGHGRALVHAAMDEARRRGYTRMTLRTYADVPWNGPFYASCGFRETRADEVGGGGGKFYDACVVREEGMGLMKYGRRVLMVAEL